MNIKKYFNKYSRIIYFILGFFLSFFVGYIRYAIGPELAISLFYLFPIVMVSWFVGRAGGIVISITSAVTWLVADLMILEYYSDPLIPYLNEAFRLTIFLFIVYIITKLIHLLKIHKELAITDPLTGIANLRAFLTIANAEIRRVQRYHHPISACYLDIDDFKTVNDSLGHAIGNKLLHLVAKIIKRNIRKLDTVARLGGDEFVILLPNTDSSSANKTVNKLQEKLRDIMNRNKWNVTFSIGVVTFNKPPESVAALLKISDDQMYLAKRNGKNLIKYKIL